jgi:hypothetical protein
MPNWCENSLTISSNDIDILNQFYLNNKTEENELDFNCICPVPSELMNAQSPNNLDDIKKQELIDKYGYDDWYSWCNNNWGTKWNTSDVEYNNYDTQLTYTFNTAWGPPNAWLTKLTEKYSDLEIRLEYEEPGMDFAGVMDYSNGILSDESYSLSEHIWENCDQGLVTNTIVTVINENFHIFEDENSDEITDMVIEELCDEIPNAYAIYSTIHELVIEYFDNNNDKIDNTSYEESILHYDDKGSDIKKLNL